MGDADSFHERAFLAVPCQRGSSAEPLERRSPPGSACLLDSEEPNELGGGFCSWGRYFRFPL